MDRSRRDAMKLGGLGIVGGVFGSSLGLGVAAKPARADSPAPGRVRIARVAHMTDMHVQPERGAEQGMAAAFRHVGALPDRPDLIITGGDTIMDSMDADHARTTTQWDLWNRVVASECPVPMKSCIGNHDVWGWNKGKSKTTGTEAKWGKGWATDALKIDERFYAFDVPTKAAQSGTNVPGPAAGWRCIVLDSVFPKGNGYIGKLDDTQMGWLEGELQTITAKRPDTNVLIVSHIPILATCVFFDSKADAPRNKEIGSGLMHEDAAELKRLFQKHPNVKACLSGHIHQVDRVEFAGVTYLCNGAVSGAWWKGRHVDCDEGYALVDLFSDGSVERQYVTYGWSARE